MNQPPLLVLAPYLTGFEINSLSPSKGSLRWEAVIRADTAALIFFETLRVMVANKVLLGCPMRWIPWAVRNPCTPKKYGSWIGVGEFSGCTYRFLGETECCGRVDLLRRLYEVGKKSGFPEQTWRKPIECLSRYSPSCLGSEVSSSLPF
jgi:hypothetical protein